MGAVMVTGGGGFVGLNLTEELLERGHTVISFGLDRPPERAVDELRGLPGTLHVESGDVRDRDAVLAALRRHEVDAVFHGAAVTAGQRRERSDPDLVVDVNVRGTIAVLDAAREAGLRRVAVASSGAVYGSAIFEHQHLDETTLLSPTSSYGITKYASERLALRLGELWEMEIVCGRVSAVFGPWEHDTGVRDTLSPLLQLAHVAVAGGHARIAAQGRRDWIYSRDVAFAFAELVTRSSLNDRLYNVVSGESWYLGDWCETLERRYPHFSFDRVSDYRDATISYDAPPDRPRGTVDCSRLRRELGSWPAHAPDVAREAYADWIEQHEWLLR